MKLFKKQEENRNPEGLTYDEFMNKYKDISKLAALCWHLGIYPEELKNEIKTLMEKY